MWIALEACNGRHLVYRKCDNCFVTYPRETDLMLLELFSLFDSKCNITEIDGFVYRSNFGDLNFKFHSSSQISQAE